MHAVILSDLADGRGGVERVAVESALALVEAGVKVTFVHALEPVDPRLEHSSVERICLNLVDIWQQRPLAALETGIWNRLAAARLAAALAPLHGAADTIVHLHHWTRAFSPAILPVLRQTGLPLFMTAHDYFLACPNGLFFRFDIKEPCHLKPMSIQCLTKNCDIRSYLHKCVRSLRGATVRHQLEDAPLELIHISDSARDKLIGFVPSCWRHHRVNNPVSAIKGAPVTIGPETSFAFVGRLTREKGVLVAAEAARLAGVPMIFIGEGPMAEEIRAVYPEAEITGWLGPAQMLEILRSRVRAVLAPSLWPETGPLTVDEALAIGLPVIASNRCGTVERLTIDCGFAVEPTVEALAEAMRRLSDVATAAAMGQAAYEHYWADPPTPAAHARKLIELYAQACARTENSAAGAAVLG